MFHKPQNRSLTFTILILLFISSIAILMASRDVRSTQTGISDDIVTNRAIGCRLLVALGQPIAKKDPCADKEIIKRNRGYEVVVVGSAANHRTTQKLICEVIRFSGMDGDNEPGTCVALGKP